ncbi:MAG TPA: acyltransferase [Rhizomicrobium sp.]|jgi:peptidoglycan/LPS O-acetylase OafA/YrhL|nr:acyltransferase [Rhizomicrobium sp.]
MQKTHIPALDGLRAVAVGLVLLSHSRVPGFHEAGIGVDIFFVLSGYLITSLLTREIEQTGKLALLKFYVRRLRRLTPPLLLLAIAYLAFAPAVWPERTAAQHASYVLAAVTYLMDFVRSGRPWFANPLEHTWSLAVEEHFYMLWPLALLGLRFLPRRFLFPALLTGCAVATLWRCAGLYLYGWETAYFRFDFRLSGLLLGAALSVVPNVGKPVRFVLYAVALGVVVVSMVYLQTALVLCTFAEAVAALTILAVLQGEAWTSWLAYPVLVYVGRVSYGFYLFHYPLTWWLTDHVPWPVTLLFAGGGGLLLASLSYHFVERPVLDGGFRQRHAPVAA